MGESAAECAGGKCRFEERSEEWADAEALLPGSDVWVCAAAKGQDLVRDPDEGREDRAEWSRLHPSLKHSGEQVLHLTSAAQ